MSSSPPESNWRRLRALSGRELGLLVRAAVLLPVVVGLLPALGYRRLRALLTHLGRPGAAAPADLEARIVETVRMVDLAIARVPVRSACLSESLVLWTLLGAQGIPADLRFGVRPGGAPLDAHAWVEHAGRPLNETPDIVGAYAVLEEPQR